MLSKIPRTSFERRSLILIGLAFMSVSACTTAAAQQIPRVLFVCQYGSVKSAIARELFRKAAGERNIAVLVSSRGITPEAHLSPIVKEKLAREMIDPERDPLQQLADVDLHDADITVLFDVLPKGMQEIGRAHV